MTWWQPSLPDDPPRALALALAVAVVVFGPRALRGPAPRALWVIAPLAAAALSAAYVAFYLRGGPRIIDATAYLLEARTFASGSFTLPIVGPEASVLGRFLVRAPDGAAVIFPPGYPAVLALGVALGAPLAVGPALAALMTLATMDLARLIAPPPLGGPMVIFAAIASVGCATLRYHTADTMAHGLAALCVTVAAAAAVRARDPRAIAAPLALGAALGLLFATRPVSALAAAVLLPLARRRLALVAAATLPGLALFAAYQGAATGSPWLTAQEVYYAVSDGPPGCFRYGFGAAGCLGEHGDFVRARMPDGYGLVEALGTTARRLALHLGDALGFAPSFALVIVGMRAAATAGLAPLALLPVSFVLAYAPFYFDGNYLGGGARMLADALPIEQGLAALGLAQIARRARRATAPWFSRGAAAVVALGLAGFAFHQGAHHRDLRDREGGRPMYDAARVPAGMVFVDTDHGFDLAFDPTLARPVARHRGDVTDWLAWQAHGQPPAWRYVHAWDGGPPDVSAMTFVTDRLEGESLWPAREQRGAWAFPVWRGGDCASGGRALQVTPAPSGAVWLTLPQGLAGGRITPVVEVEMGNIFNGLYNAGAVALWAGGRRAHRWVIAASPGCQTLEAVEVPAADHLALEVQVSAPILLDALGIRITR